MTKIVNISITKVVLIAVTLIVLFMIGIFSQNIVENNIQGYYQIKQSWRKGEMSIRNTPGMYMQNFGKLYTFKQ